MVEACKNIALDFSACSLQREAEDVGAFGAAFDIIMERSLIF